MLSSSKGFTKPFIHILIGSTLVLVTLIGVAFSPGQSYVVHAKELTVDYIAEKLAARVQNVIDLSATVAFTQTSSRNGARSDGEIQLQAIFPGLVRAAWTNPDILRGLLWILDTHNDRFTQYEPSTGEARHHPLSEILADYPPLPLTPEQLFSLPSSEQYELEVAEQSSEGERPYAMVRAVDKKTKSEYRVWVDITDWMVTRVESLNSGGAVQVSAWVREIHMNLGLSAADIRALPPGTIERPMP